MDLHLSCNMKRDMVVYRKEVQWRMRTLIYYYIAILH